MTGNTFVKTEGNILFHIEKISKPTESKSFTLSAFWRILEMNPRRGFFLSRIVDFGDGPLARNVAKMHNRAGMNQIYD